MYNLYKNWTNLCRYRTKALRIHRFIPGESRSPRIDEHDFAGIGKYLEIVAALRRELRHRYGSVLVGALFQEILTSEYPFVPLLRVSGESSP